MSRIALLTLTLITSLGCGEDAIEALPELGSLSPGVGASVPSSTWFWLDFLEEVEPGALHSFSLRCSSEKVEFDVELVGGLSVLINPKSLLPKGATCELAWQGPSGAILLEVEVNKQEGHELGYDRGDTSLIAPFPDDHWRSEGRLQVDAPTRDEDGTFVIQSFVDVIDSDGFSPISPIVIEMPVAIEASSVPRTTAESVSVRSSIVLIDIDGPHPGTRVAFFSTYQNESDHDGSEARHLLLFPAKPLRSGGQYILVVTTQVLNAEQGPILPSAFMTKVLGQTLPEEEVAARAHKRLAPDMEVLLQEASPAIRRQDIALALPFTIRNMERVAEDRLAIREQVMAMPVPSYQVNTVTPVASNPSIAAIVRGTWQAPIWNEGNFLLRDEQGRPTSSGTRDISFTLALPMSSATASAPLIMFQHGSPGTAAQVSWAANNLAGSEIDFAVIGFTDLNNRTNDGIMLTEALFMELVETKKFPELLWEIAFAEQLSFIRFVGGLDDLDVLPLAKPDGIADLDTSWLGFFGVSQGANQGAGLLPYAPEIRAAALTVGGGNYAGIMTHQSQSVLDIVFEQYPGLSRSELYVAIALMQLAVDWHEPLNHARFLYQDPHELGREQRASVLLSEGLGDSFVPAWSTQSGAAAFGMPQLAPVHLPAPFLVEEASEVTANINATTTAGFVQYVPADYSGAVPTPSCQQSGKDEGHFCPQSSVEATLQRQQFFSSAKRDAAATISDFSSEAASLQLPSSVVGGVDLL